MDATPVTLGQEFGGYAAPVRYGVERLQASLPGSASCRWAARRWAPASTPRPGSRPRSSSGSPPTWTCRCPRRATTSRRRAPGTRLVEGSGQLKTIAVGLVKIANDLRWMGSGPRTGLGEIALPDLQPGSSIMPGKVNPVIPEAVIQVGAQVIGNDAAVTYAGAAGVFELNVTLPLMARNVLESIRLLANVSRLLADRCIDGITANVEQCRTYAESSPSIVTPLNKYIGYEEAAKVAKQSLAEQKTIRQVVVERGYVEQGKLTEEQLDAALDVLSMTHP